MLTMPLQSDERQVQGTIYRKNNNSISNEFAQNNKYKREKKSMIANAPKVRQQLLPVH